MISSSVNERQMVKKSKEHIECLRVVGPLKKKYFCFLNKSVREEHHIIITMERKGRYLVLKY